MSSNPNPLSRQSFLKGAASLAGAALGTRVVGRGGLEGEARAEAERPALVVVFLKGGYNALFSSAGGLVGRFGVTSEGVEDLGDGLVVDASTYGTLPDTVKKRMATIGVAHGLTSHDDLQMRKWWSNEDRSYVLQLASALGGDGAIKAAIVGEESVPGPRPSEGGVSLQPVLDMGAALAAMGVKVGGADESTAPSRGVAAAALARCAAMSRDAIERNPAALVALDEAYPTGEALLAKAPMKFSFDDLSSAYGLGGSTSVRTFASQMAAAELMITSGTNVVVAADFDDVWDSHGSTDGAYERASMRSRILPSLQTFLGRMLGDPRRNVAMAVMGDFARSLPDSDHQPNCAVTVFGKYVKTGNTGRVDARADMPDDTPDVRQLWSYLAAILKAPGTPFGANPHALVR